MTDYWTALERSLVGPVRELEQERKLADKDGGARGPPHVASRDRLDRPARLRNEGRESGPALPSRALFGGILRGRPNHSTSQRDNGSGIAFRKNVLFLSQVYPCRPGGFIMGKVDKSRR